jgi:hypothetical protein
MFEPIIKELLNLTISASKKSPKTGLSILTELCNRFLDSLPEKKGLLPAIEHEDESDCAQIANQLKKKMSYLNAILDSVMAMIISLTKTLEAVVKSDNFDLPVFKTFLKEVVVVLDLILSSEYATKLPVSWIFFSNIAANQLRLFGCYIKAKTYQDAQEILWEMSNDTDSQKKFLKRCIFESIGFEDFMSEVGAVLESMLSLQARFILNLIARLQRSKNAEGPETLEWVAV